MSRLTLRLPESLHRQLEERAKQENVSLNQYLVYALTRCASIPSGMAAFSQHDVARQRADYERLLQSQSLRRGTTEEVRAALDEAVIVPPEPDLDPDLVQRLQLRINEARASYDPGSGEA